MTEKSNKEEKDGGGGGDGGKEEEGHGEGLEKYMGPPDTETETHKHPTEPEGGETITETGEEETTTPTSHVTHEPITQTNLNNGDTIIHPKKGTATIIKKYTSGCQVQIQGKDKKEYIKWYNLTIDWKKQTTPQNAPPTPPAPQQAPSKKTTQPQQPPKNHRRAEGPPTGGPPTRKTEEKEEKAAGAAPPPEKNKKETPRNTTGGNERQNGGETPPPPKKAAPQRPAGGEKEGEGGPGEEGGKEGERCPTCKGTGISPFDDAESLPKDVQDDLDYVINVLMPRAAMVDRLGLPVNLREVILKQITRHKHYIKEEEEKEGKKEVPPATDRQVGLIGDLLTEIGYKKSIDIVLGELNIEQAKKIIDGLFKLKEKKKDGGSS